MDNTTTVDSIFERIRSLFKEQLDVTPVEIEGRRAGQKKLHYLSRRKDLKREGFDGAILVACVAIYDTELDSLNIDDFVRMHDALPVFNVD